MTVEQHILSDWPKNAPADYRKMQKAAEAFNETLSHKKKEIVIIKSRNSLNQELSGLMGTNLKLYAEKEGVPTIQLFYVNEMHSIRENFVHRFRELGSSDIRVSPHLFYDFGKLTFQRKMFSNQKELENLFYSDISSFLLTHEKMLVIPKPKIFLDNEGRLHNESGYAMKILDREFFFIGGVYFDNSAVWEKAVTRKMSFEDVMRLDNIERRRAALKYMDADDLLGNIDANLIHKSDRGNQLYHTENRIFRDEAYFLKYTCPSTGKVYLSGIDPDFARENPDADICMAWKFGFTEEQYKELIIET